MNNLSIQILIGIIYYSSNFDLIQAVSYKGPVNVRENEPWEIKCTGLKPGEKFNWTRNEEQIEELPTGEIIVFRPNKESCVMKSDHATVSHEGSYKCTLNSTESFFLNVIPVVKSKVLTNDDVPMNLDCENPSVQINWTKDGIPVSEAFAEKNNLVEVKNGVLTIFKNTEVVYGNYSCVSKNQTSLFQIVPKPIVSLSKTITVIEGSSLYFTCQGNFYPRIKIMWEFAGKNYTYSSGRVKLLYNEDTGIHNALLRVGGIKLSESGNITCKAAYDWNDSPNHMDSATSLLNVMARRD